MSTKAENVVVTYCDCCGARERKDLTVHQCWACGCDCCSACYHLVQANIDGCKTYLCSECYDVMKECVILLFDNFKGGKRRDNSDRSHEK